MFTGLIEQIGTVASIEPRGTGARLLLTHAPWETPLAPGESIAVSGICLTAADVSREQFACDVLEETLRRTNLGRKRPGSLVNLERALRADGRFGGHLVAGHVDGVGAVSRLERIGNDWLLAVDCGAALAAGMVVKGSIAVDGISLTVTHVEAARFQTHLIPFTWEHTCLKNARVGDLVNLETDMVGKYLAKFLAQSGAPAAGLDFEALRRAGFA